MKKTLAVAVFAAVYRDQMAQKKEATPFEYQGITVRPNCYADALLFAPTPLCPRYGFELSDFGAAWSRCPQ